ncbi:PDZ domain-containing protein [bacterium]|nr:PDZ domain-containing protein [bacterium]
MARTARILLIAVLALGLMAGIGEAKSKRTAWMGVYTQSVDRELADALKLDVDRGAIITNVADDSPAEKAGLQKDDIIIAVDSESIDRAADLTRAIADHRAGDEVTVKVLRDGQEKDLTVTLDSRRRGDVVIWSLDDNSRLPEAFTLRDAYRMEPRGYLGVQIDDLSPQLGEYFGVEKARGALVTEVEKDSPASKAGLKAGDVIVSLDEETVYDSRDVTDLIREKKKGDQVAVTVVRDRKEVKLNATVDETDDSTYGLLRLPDLPDIDVNVPKMHGLRFGDTKAIFESEDFQKEMQELREELRQLQSELEDLRLELQEQ